MLKVLSLFDGASGGNQALERLGITDYTYYSAEIDKYAISVTQKNFPNTIQIGSVTDIWIDGTWLRVGDGTEKIWQIDGGIDLLIGGSPCFVAGTKVITKNGYKNIEDIKVGDEVLTHNGRFRKVLKIGGQEKGIWSVRGQGFKTTLTTENHPYLVSKCPRIWNNSIRSSERVLQKEDWVKVKDIEKGDYVGLPIIEVEGENRFNLTKQDCWLLGRYLADGHTNKTLRKRNLNTRYFQVIYSIGNMKLEDFNHITEYHITKHPHAKSVYRFIVSSKRLVEIIDSINIGHGAINKKIPIEIMLLPKDLLQEFFNGYISGDGHINKKGEYNASSISEELIMGLNLVVAKLYGTNSSYSYFKRPKITVIEGRTVNQNDSFSTRFKIDVKKQTHSITRDGIIWLPIKEVKDLEYTDKVYNLAVEEDNSYTANNIIVHNCQGFSFAGKQLNFEDERSKLFFEYVRILKEVKPRYFMLENVKMKKEFSDIITEQLFGITFTEINSSLLSAQNRKRLYWVGERQEDGTYKKLEIGQLEDRGILLKDILEENVDEKYNISNKHTEAMLRYRSSGKLNLPNIEGKCGTITASYFKIPQDGPYIHQLNNPTHSNNRIYGIDGKCPTLNTMQGGNRQPKILEDNTSYIGYALGSREFKATGWKSGKSPTLCARDYKDPKVILENTNPLRIRKLTVTEAERLQTIKDGYTAIGLVNGVEVPISNSQRYKMIGNGWTTDIIAFIFSHLDLGKN